MQPLVLGKMLIDELLGLDGQRLSLAIAIDDHLHRFVALMIGKQLIDEVPFAVDGLTIDRNDLSPSLRPV